MFGILDKKANFICQTHLNKVSQKIYYLLNKNFI